MPLLKPAHASALLSMNVSAGTQRRSIDSPPSGNGDFSSGRKRERRRSSRGIVDGRALAELRGVAEMTNWRLFKFSESRRNTILHKLMIWLTRHQKQRRIGGH
ncbi:hypothetical protein MTP99_018533 [Tenebrio molitor]|nr:hypothetical protein MTP99_018533 [Tenebrio molitor]